MNLACHLKAGWTVLTWQFILRFVVVQVFIGSAFMYCVCLLEVAARQVFLLGLILHLAKTNWWDRILFLLAHQNHHQMINSRLTLVYVGYTFGIYVISNTCRAYCTLKGQVYGLHGQISRESGVLMTHIIFPSRFVLVADVMRSLAMTRRNGKYRMQQAKDWRTHVPPWWTSKWEYVWLSWIVYVICFLYV